MQVNREIRHRIRRSSRGVAVVADVNVAVAGAIGEPAATTRTSVQTRQTVVQGRPRATADVNDAKEAK